MEMVRRGARALVSGFRPVDRLDGIDKTPGRQSSTIKDTSSPQQPLSSPIKTQAQQTNNNLAHTGAHFVLSPPQYGASVKSPPNPRKRSFDKTATGSDGSQSQNTGISGALAFGHSNVSEYRSTIRKATAKKRTRYRAGGAMRQEIHDDPIIVDDLAEDDVQVVPSNGQQATLNSTRPDKLGRKHSANVSPPQMGNANNSLEMSDPSLLKRKRSGDSPDDLAPTLAEIEAKRRKPEQMRGHINRGKFVWHGSNRPHTASQRPTLLHKDPVLEKSLKIIGQGLQLRRAVSGSKTYDDATEPDTEHMMLALSEMSFILHPLAKDGTIATELQWCTVNLHKVQWLEAARTDTDSRLIYISRSSDASTGSSGLLALHFVASEHVRAFVDWCSIHKRVSLPRLLPNERLEKKFEVAWAEAEKQQQSAQSAAGKSSHKPDDIALIEQNHARRTTAPSRPAELNETKKPKLKDTMSATENPATSTDLHAIPVESSLSPRRTARTTRAAIVPREPSPILPCAPSWTSQNPKWSDKWRNSIVFPATGKNRAVVDKADIERLDEGEFLNDNLIIFYLRYLQVNLETHSKALAERIYFHNTFFFERLKPTRSGAGISFENVKGWTTKVDLFSKDFIVVPINEHSHWYVAIICNAPKLLKLAMPEKEDAARIEDRPDFVLENPPTETTQATEPRSPIERVVSDLPGPCEAQLAVNMSRIRVGSPTTALDADEGIPPNQPEVKNILSRKKLGKRQSTGRRKDPTQPRIITLDSLSSSHSPACGYLKQYLVAELKDKKGIDIADPGAMGMTARNIPVQQNFCDCGLYLLGYIKKFLEDPDAFVRSIMDQNDIDWNLDPSALRNDIRELLFTFQEEQQKQENLEAEDRKKRKRKVLKAKQEQEAEKPKLGSPAESSTVPAVPAPQVATELAQSLPLADKQPIKSVEVSHLLRATTESSQGHHDANHSAHEAPVVHNSQESVAEKPVILLQGDQTLAKDHNSSIVDTGQLFVSPLPESSASSPSPAPRDESKTLPDDPNRLQSKANSARDVPGQQRRIEVSLPRKPSTSNRPGPERRIMSSPGKKKTGESSHYFAGKRHGDQPGRARLRQTPPGSKAQQSAIIELPSDSD